MFDIFTNILVADRRCVFWESKDNFVHCHKKHFILTLKCLSIGTPKIINFPFGTNGKFIIFRFPKIWAHCGLIIMCLNTDCDT